MPGDTGSAGVYDGEMRVALTGATDARAIQERVRAYWDGKPCDSDLSERERSSKEYFLEIEQRRYQLQPHIPEILAKIDWRGKRVLEIGSGVGTDARAIIARGGVYTGINIDRTSTELTEAALRVFSLPGVSLQGDATALRFPDNAFDAVYAFGVLHHIVDAQQAVREIHRVLRPSGELLAMLYNRDSINYRVEILFLRRLAVHVLALPGATAALGAIGLPRAKLERHRELYQSRGPPPGAEWLSRNTNGPDNPYAQVYGAAQAVQLLAPFQVLSNDVYFFDHRHWGLLGSLVPVRARLRLGRLWGWHRVLHVRKVPQGG